MTELQVTRDGKDALEILVDKFHVETQEEKKHANKLEKKLKEVFTKILDNVQATMSSATENIQIITQTLEYYKKEIEELK
jgi:hypothetical protein